ncbi:uncharacterized protein LOC8258636 isoform X2 [Ricinus communis]|nr:uncharacterized protein LOC8258636 isoform X2 [Ricinus communis]XP_025013636.1 uncharacterized protein LOC8258636 isoform X2 [Ricinus communis]XP_048235850.1 uncharacterized protein LOC8258636 isoform X2 [Ricinus communis]XP_048235851.1 uncharacterized protein LOC8258636 isoform X2 [Ricinus communis]|eukprot:XP_025013635.1 uncharacterized protein LOC8258636 isoform X2 [Ricinus communis]
MAISSQSGENNMEPLGRKSLERVVSQRALQMSSSFPCQLCVVGFLCGVCLTSLFLAALTSLGTFAFGGISFSAVSIRNSSPWNSSSEFINVAASTDCKFKLMETERWDDSQRTHDEKVSLLHSAWSALLSESVDVEFENFQNLGLSKSAVPNGPHLENCKLSAQINKRLDKQAENESFPPWTTWKGLLDMHPASTANEQLRYYRHQAISEGAYPPWISGSDEDNYPLTRKVQRDIWIHQHPPNCKDPNVKFLVADWEKLPGFGIGAQLVGMSGLLAIALKDKRVLVTSYYNRADHDGCKGTSRSSWSCYFFPETSQECRDHALELMANKEAWENGSITTKENYNSKEIWTGRTPRIWGDPWSYLQPTTEINGSLITFHHKMDRRWWRAQAIRYLMRFQTEYTCGLMNVARNAAFGKEVAKMVLASLEDKWPKEVTNKPVSDIQRFVWSSHKPWVPRPLLSMHVRMGDKACEMKVVEFEEYMHLADQLRRQFPHLNSIWLSTEMQEVIDKLEKYTDWKFYYSNVTRQVGNTTMAEYEASLGRQTSTNYPLVNFLMATEADFFIGALGSTWCFLIDGMRNTGGKVMAGYLSVNRDRFW